METRYTIFVLCSVIPENSCKIYKSRCVCSIIYCICNSYLISVIFRTVCMDLKLKVTFLITTCMYKSSLILINSIFNFFIKSNNSLCLKVSAIDYITCQFYHHPFSLLIINSIIYYIHFFFIHSCTNILKQLAKYRKINVSSIVVTM